MGVFYFAAFKPRERRKHISNETEIRLIAAVKYSTTIYSTAMEASEVAEMASLMAEQNPKGTAIKPTFLRIDGKSQAVGFMADVPTETEVDVQKRIMDAISDHKGSLAGKIICIYSDSRYIPKEMPSSFYPDKLDAEEAAFLIDGTEYLHVKKYRGNWYFTFHLSDFTMIYSGVITSPSLNILEARDEAIKKMFGKDGAVITTLNLDHFLEEMGHSKNGEDVRPLPYTLDYALV